MEYDKENDRFIDVDPDSTLRILSNGVTWQKSDKVSIEIGEDYLEVPISKISDLIDGLKQAKARAQQ